MTRSQEQIANQTSIRRTSANNGLPYRQSQLSQQDGDIYDDEWPPRVPNSAIRYTTTNPTPVIVSGNRRYVLHTGPPQQTTHMPRCVEDEAPGQKRRVHWSLIF